MPRKVDANQSAIVDALRRVGASVQILSQVGHGCPDLLVGYRGHDKKMEVKSDDGKLTPAEADWHESWSGESPVIIRSIGEALLAIGAAEYKPSETKG